MRKEIQGYIHHAGRHCGSTSLSNVARFWGLGLSEPFCFGLGAGLGFMYMALPGASPSRAFFPRNHSMESDFLDRAGAQWSLNTVPAGTDSFEAVRAEIDAGHPVIVNCDIFYLKYFQSRTHFNGHKIVITGYDTDPGRAIISDSEFDTIQEEPLESLAAARGSAAQPGMGAGSPWFRIRFPEKKTDWTLPVREAVLTQADGLLDPAKPFSLAAMTRAADDLPRWAEIPDLKWTSRFAYQIIEKRGTGGGAFRKMYGDFLTEAATAVPALEGLGHDMASIGAKWTELSAILKAVSELDGERPDPAKAAPLLQQGAGLLREIQQAETRLFSAARERLR